jgi:OOP family OmpA-OmpF porin
MRTFTTLTRLATAATLALAVAPIPRADAQSWGDRLKKKAEEAAKRKVEGRTEQRAGEAADKALDKVECAAADKTCQDRKAAAQQGGAAGGEAAVAVKPGEGAWANYDFKPGDRILFADDFTRDDVGDFPKRLEFRSGQIEIVEWQSGRWLRSGNTGEFLIPLSETLPDRFTIEFDVSGHGNAMLLTFDGNAGGSSKRLWVGQDYGSMSSGDINARGQFPYNTREMPIHIAIAVDGMRAKMYANETRVFNAPNGDLGRSKKIYVAMNGWDASNPRLITNLRIAAGGKKLYDALAEKGRVATQGIYFDTGSDRIRPESTPTLKEIGQMLSEHPELKLTIEGHTDNVGNAAANQALSEKRAAAVRAYLAEKHSIDGSRLNSAGFGDKKPAAPNTTPEGRQQNRRVELVKM